MDIKKIKPGKAIEVDCRKCKHVDLEHQRCKLYGDGAVDKCIKDLFRNYEPCPSHSTD